VQDEIAEKFAAALRITLSPQEQQALSANRRGFAGYDLYLRGRNYARQVGRQDLQFALQMYENAVALDPDFALAHAGLANVCAEYYYHSSGNRSGSIGPLPRRGRRARKSRCSGDPMRRGVVMFADGRYGEAVDKIRMALSRNPDHDGGYYLLDAPFSPPDDTRKSWTSWRRR